MTADLSAFILARIDEEQAAAENNDWLAFEYGVDSFGRQAFSTRVLAQCAALRRIVELVDDWEASDEVLRALAPIWRDHPDYDEAVAVTVYRSVEEAALDVLESGEGDA